MGLRTRLKGLIKAQVRERLGSFNVSAESAPPPVRPAVVEEEPPPARTIIRPPRVPDPEPEATEAEGLRIRAEAAAGAGRCLLHTSRQLLEGASWWFEDAEAAADSPLAKALLAVDGIDEVIVHGPTVVLISDSPGPDWRALATEAGRLVREHAGAPVLPADLAEALPGASEVRERIQAVLDEEVNPGVAAHSGHISLEAVDGNAVTIRMGGGCQGCSAADLTLRQGIYSAFRRAVPNLGAIYDATDHAAGRNPWFSEP